MPEVLYKAAWSKERKSGKSFLIELWDPMEVLSLEDTIEGFGPVLIDLTLMVNGARTDTIE